jgi:hypothetical protein
MVYCNNETCRFCAIDTELARGGVKVCTVDPVFIRVGSLKEWMLKCNNYKYRPIGQTIKPIVPIGFDGLYPGQLKPPTDYTDIDPAEKVVAVGPKGGEEECDT